MGFSELLRNFFTHKDFLPPPDKVPGTLFTPMQMLFCGIIALLIVFFAIRCAKKSEKYQKTVFFVIWLGMVITEVIIILYDGCAGKEILFNNADVWPLWPCSIFLYAAPFSIFGKGKVRYAACGYICTLGLLGGAVNFVYPATYLASYSCISFAGLRTIYFHGGIVFTALTMLISGYHSFKKAKSYGDLLLPAVPLLITSIPANTVNFLVPEADYMFFKLKSFFFAPIGNALPEIVSLVAVYVIYLIIHCVPYIPSFIKSKKKETVNA